MKDVFAGFAEEFDARLASLKYRAPELVVGAIDRAVGPEGGLCVLDAGAGTGLCGPLLRARAERLVGVDLSGKMLEQAARRGVYDELAEAELTAWLDATPETFDVAVCADTLCYFGVLDNVLAGLGRVLIPGGWIAFTVERSADEDEDPYRLHYHGRYSHSERYVREAVARAGLRIRDVDRQVLRLELGEPVHGLVVLASRPS